MSREAVRFTPRRIARACGGQVVAGPPDAAAGGVSTDTRTLRRGQAFFALVGPQHDAHDYLAQASERGASIFVVQREAAGWRAPAGTAVVRVQDTARALLALGAWHRGRLRARVAAVTGSYGKSTVKAMLGAALGRVGRCTVAQASYNNRVGVALTLLAARPTDEFLVLEMGTNHPGEIDELARAARPDVGIITAIGAVHLEGLGSLDGVREAKAELITHLNPSGTLLLNADDPRCASLADGFAGRVRTFGTSDGADVQARRIGPRGAGWRFEALGHTVWLPSGARHDVLNAAAALAGAEALGVPTLSAAAALERAVRPPLRYERLRLGGVAFIRDCYNSNPPALRSALRSFLLEENPGRKVVVCGDMLELGERSPELHRQMGAELAECGVHILVAVGEMGPHLVEGWHTRAMPPRFALWFPAARQAWLPLWRELRPGDAVLVKGSRGVKLETITDHIAAHIERTEAEEAA